ncbi:hypothetical protein KBI23_12395 [bacterium]|nr:hypothetical protein [bacterium]
MSRLLITMAEDVEKSTASEFALKYSVDEYDSLHFAQSLKELGHHVYFVNWRDLLIDLPSASRFDRMYSYNDECFVAPVALLDFDLVFVYKMEGFYRDSQRFNDMLSCFSHCKVINDIGTIKHNFNKSYLWQLQERDVRIIPSFKVCDIKDRLSQGERFVVKPLCGERGNEIFLANQPLDLFSIEGCEDAFFAQQFMPEIWQGERSLVFLGDQFQHAVIKLPSRANQSEFRCNESLGGTVDVYEATEQEINFAKRVLRVYEGLGYPAHFSRVDILSVEGFPMLLEAELLNPSMYANYSKKGEAFGKQLALYFDRFIKN